MIDTLIIYHAKIYMYIKISIKIKYLRLELNDPS